MIPIFNGGKGMRAVRITPNLSRGVNNINWGFAATLIWLGSSAVILRGESGTVSLRRSGASTTFSATFTVSPDGTGISIDCGSNTPDNSRVPEIVAAG